jgi:uncharacterized surface protein with fasciclin (FAS1) repeats
MKQFFLSAKAILLGLSGLVVIGSTSCKKSDPSPAPGPQNLFQIIRADTGLSILSSALDKAGLSAAVSTTNNITVFAPTNNAFRASGFPQSVIDALTPAQVSSILAPVLTYHVVPAVVRAANVPASDTVKTLNGKNIYASSNGNGVFMNGIRVTTPDITGSNGVIHKISSGVLIPPTKSIAQIVIDDPANFSLLLAAVSRAGLAGALSGPGKFTVFAPTNTAFQATPFNTEAIINAADPTAVAGIVKAHAIATNVFASDLSNGATAPTLNGGGQTLTVSLPPAVKITGSSSPASNVTAANIIATNGVIHVVDRVILYYRLDICNGPIILAQTAITSALYGKISG